MSIVIKPAVTEIELTDNTFLKFSTFIHSNFGIMLPPSKKSMLQGRLLKRLRKTGITSFETYFKIVTSGVNPQELKEMINVVSTNKTDFFREPYQFNFLTETAVPYLLKNYKSDYYNPFIFWSAGCSTGEEPYTMSMVLSEYALTRAEFNFRILATDISTNVLETAKQAVYSKDLIKPIPLHLRKKYLLRGKNSQNGQVKIAPELRKKINYKRLNFMDDFTLQEKAHAIFCRNVVIYFDDAFKQELIQKFYDNLAPGGYLFLGHSETLSRLETPFKLLEPTIYQKV